VLEAAQHGVTACVVKIENFDEVSAALARQASLSPSSRQYVSGLKDRPRVVDAAMPSLDSGVLPVLRMNALPITEAPSVALNATFQREIEVREVRRLLKEVGWRGTVASGGSQILAFGSASELKKALPINTPEVVPFQGLSGDANSLHRSLALQALALGLARRLPMRAVTRPQQTHLVVRPIDQSRHESDPAGRARELLLRAYGESLTGTAPASLGKGPDGAPRVWAEGVRLSLDWRLDRLWLLFVPFTWVSRPAISTDTRNGRGDPASAWRKERWVNRRNERWAEIIDAWATALAPRDPTEIVVVGGKQAMDVVGGAFQMAKTTAFSRLAQ
jgi:hypothetical protein